MKYALEVEARFPAEPECTQFAEDLLRAYMRWCDRRIFKLSTVQVVDGEWGGIKRAIVFIEGDASDLLKENGYHRKLALPIFRNTEKVCVSQAFVHCYKLTDDRADVQFEHKRRGAGGGGYCTDLLIASSDRGELTIEVTRNRIERAKEDAIAVLSSRTERNETEVRRWRFHPSSEFYVKDSTGRGFSTKEDVKRFFEGEF